MNRDSRRPRRNAHRIAPTPRAKCKIERHIHALSASPKTLAGQESVAPAPKSPSCSMPLSATGVNTTFTPRCAKLQRRARPGEDSRPLRLSPLPAAPFTPPASGLDRNASGPRPNPIQYLGRSWTIAPPPRTTPASGSRSGQVHSSGASPLNPPPRHPAGPTSPRITAPRTPAQSTPAARSIFSGFLLVKKIKFFD